MAPTDDDARGSNRLRIGCTELPPGMSRRDYFATLEVLETRFPGDRVPADAVLARWRRAAGRPGRYALIAPRDLCAPHRAGLDRAQQARLAARLAAAAVHLEAAAVLFATPDDLSPSAAHRDSVRRLFEELCPPAPFGPARRVWQPGGLWSAPDAHALASELGVVAAHDPLAQDVLEEGRPEAGAVAYARISGLGRPARALSEDALAEVAEWIQPAEWAVVAFATARRFDDARGLVRQVERSAPAEPIGK